MLYIPFQYDKVYEGGVKTFMFNLKNFLDKKSYKYTSEPKNATDIFFPNYIFEKDVIELVKQKGGNVIQRLDGVHHPKIVDNKYSGDDEKIKDIYLNFSDFIIFQSDYSKKVCFEVYGKKNDQEYTIIINGVNKEIFYPSEQKTRNNKIKFVATGNFRKRVMLEPSIKALDSLKNKIDFEYHIVGNISEPSLKDLLEREYIIYHPKTDLDGVAQILRESDIYIHCGINDPCPNSALEAISAALPIVGFDTGSMKELCFFSKELLADVSEELFHLPEDLKFDKLAEKILFAANNFDKYKSIALTNSNLYSFEECGNSYIEVFEKQTCDRKKSLLDNLKKIFKS